MTTAELYDDVEWWHEEETDSLRVIESDLNFVTGPHGTCLLLMNENGPFGPDTKDILWGSLKGKYTMYVEESHLGNGPIGD